MHICDIQDVTMVAKIECRENFMQRLLYRLEGSESYQVKDGTVTAAYGVAVTAVARWLRPVRYTDGVRHWRFARLEVICAGKGYLFAIPVNRIGKPFDLPGLEFNETEVKLLHLIADELRRPKDWREEVIKIRDRSKENLKANRTIAEQLPTNTSNAQLMLREPWVAEVMLTAVLTNLRPWFPRGEIPGFVTNFVVPSRGSDGSTEEALQGLLRSFAFLRDGQRGFLQELEFDSKEELCRWRDDGTQFSLLYGKKAIVATLQREIRRAPAGEAVFSSHPMVINGKEMTGQYITNVVLPNRCVPWTATQLDSMRSLMRDLLLTPRKLVKRIIAVHHRELVQPDAYRKNTSSIWLNATRACIVDKVPELRSVMKNASAEAEVINLERAEKLKSGMALLTDPREYCQEIGKFPDSDKEAKERLAADYICLEHSVKGDSLLIFTKESMLRLLRRRGLDESFLELVYQKLSHSDALRSRSDSLHFAKSANGRFVTIYAKKFENYAIS